jgi:hypothetical protein
MMHEVGRSLCAADLPMSILNCRLIFFEGSTDKTVRDRPSKVLVRR